MYSIPFASATFCNAYQGHNPKIITLTFSFSAGLSKRNGAKFGELRSDFPLLTVHGQATLPGRTKSGNFITLSLTM